MVIDMTIGAIGAYSFQPYVYNVNTISAASMDKLARISDDVLDKKIDYSELVEEKQNENPLKKGQTLNFQSMLEKQMQKGRLNAARIMKPAEDTQTLEETVQAADSVWSNDALSIGAAETTPVSNADLTAADNTGNRYSSYQMQQAINAYEMTMTA